MGLASFLKSHSPEPLEYLFKVLSIDKCLSIQVHPNKEKALELHLKDPANYPDGNHKPEMAIALGKFRALANFAHKDVILGNLARYPLFCVQIQAQLEKLTSCEETNEGACTHCLKELLSKMGGL